MWTTLSVLWLPTVLGTVQQLSTTLGLVSFIILTHSVKLLLSGNCPVLTNPMNGAFGPVSSRLPGSTVTIQCDAGYVSAVTMVTCEGTLMWSPDPEAIECTSLTTPTPTTRELSSWLYAIFILH